MMRIGIKIKVPEWVRVILELAVLWICILVVLVFG